MELNQLEYFKILARTNHFTQAAQTLSISQPALSRSIAKLEQELGVPLFYRTGKKIALTQYGQLFLIYAQRALQEISSGKQALSNLADPGQGVIHLSFLHSLGVYLIPILLSRFRRLYPKIQFQLHQNNSAALSTLLHDAETDLCLSSTLQTTEMTGWVSLCSEELFLIVPEKHPLAALKRIRLADAAHEPFIMFKPSYGLRMLADQFLETASVRPEIAFEGDEIMTVAGLVDANLGVALIPHIPGLNHLGIVFLSVESPVCSRPLGLAWNIGKELSPAAKKFRQFVIDAFDNGMPYSNSAPDA